MSRQALVIAALEKKAIAADNVCPYVVTISISQHEPDEWCEHHSFAICLHRLPEFEEALRQNLPQMCTLHAEADPV